MAKKGQKFMEYDNEFREKVVLDYLNSNLGYKRIAENIKENIPQAVYDQIILTNDLQKLQILKNF